MPLVYQQNINAVTKIAVWHITEHEDFFLKEVPLQREIRHWHKRLQHLAGRLLLKEMYPDFPIELIRIADTKKPFLENEPFHFSISHCGDYAAAIVSKDFRVGIDIEIPLEKILKIKHKFINTKEDFFITPLYGVEQIELITLVWSAKETLFKWYGKGNLDFKEMMHVEPTSIIKAGSIKAEIKTSDFQKTFEIFYQQFQHLILTYTFTSK